MGHTFMSAMQGQQQCTMPASALQQYVPTLPGLQPGSGELNMQQQSVMTLMQMVGSGTPCNAFAIAAANSMAPGVDTSPMSTTQGGQLPMQTAFPMPLSPPHDLACRGQSG